MFNAFCDAKELCRHAKSAEDCVRLVAKKSTLHWVAREFKERSCGDRTRVLTRAHSFTKKDILNALRWQTSATAAAFFVYIQRRSSWEDVLYFNRLLQDDRTNSFRKRIGVEKRDEFLWSVDANEAPESIRGLIQMFSGETAASSKCDVLAAYPAHVVWLSLNAKQERSLFAHGHTSARLPSSLKWRDGNRKTQETIRER